jgi:hypothetical protein
VLKLVGLYVSYVGHGVWCSYVGRIHGGHNASTTWGKSTLARMVTYCVSSCPIIGIECFDADVLTGFETTISDGMHIISIPRQQRRLRLPRRHHHHRVAPQHQGRHCSCLLQLVTAFTFDPTTFPLNHLELFCFIGEAHTKCWMKCLGGVNALLPLYL